MHESGRICCAHIHAVYYIANVTAVEDTEQIVVTSAPALSVHQTAVAESPNHGVIDDQEHSNGTTVLHSLDSTAKFIDDDCIVDETVNQTSDGQKALEIAKQIKNNMQVWINRYDDPKNIAGAAVMLPCLTEMQKLLPARVTQMPLPWIRLTKAGVEKCQLRKEHFFPWQSAGKRRRKLRLKRSKSAARLKLEWRDISPR